MGNVNCNCNNNEDGPQTLDLENGSGPQKKIAVQTKQMAAADMRQEETSLK